MKIGSNGMMPFALINPWKFYILKSRAADGAEMCVCMSSHIAYDVNMNAIESE